MSGPLLPLGNGLQPGVFVGEKFDEFAFLYRFFAFEFLSFTKKI